MGRELLSELALKAPDLGKVRHLVNKGASLSEKDAYKRTALHWAAAHGFTEIAELMIEGGANPSVKDIAGDKPFHLSMKEERHDTTQLLLYSDNGEALDELVESVKTWQERREKGKLAAERRKQAEEKRLREEFDNHLKDGLPLKKPLKLPPKIILKKNTPPQKGPE